MFKDSTKAEITNKIISIVSMTLFFLVAFWYWFGLNLK